MTTAVDFAVIGGGQAGLAMGYHLALQGRNFVILDGAPSVGHAWRIRYDSLRLFTPAEYNNLPGLPFPKAPGLYPTKDEVAAYLELYARTFDLPVRLNMRVTKVSQHGAGYRVETDSAVYLANQVVVATGPFQRPYTPGFGASLAPTVHQVHSSRYRNPDDLPGGPVLVVGAGNSGAQIAEELGPRRKVYLSVSKRPHSLPKHFLGRHLFWWCDKLGLLDVTADSLLGKRMRQSEPLIGTDLGRVARENAVALVGRTVGAEDDRVITADGRSLEVASVVWATGFRPDYSWLQAPVFDETGKPVHKRGVTSVAGLYFLGLPWQHTRGSALLGGVGRDASYLAAVISETEKLNLVQSNAS